MTGPTVPLVTAASLAQRAVEEQADTPRPHLRDRLRSLADLATLPPVRPLVDGLLYRGTIAQIAGPPGSYKSFISLGIACAVALGRDWEGHGVPAAGVVVYVCAEGASGMRARVLAWCHYHGVDPADLEGRLFFVPEPVNLGDSSQVSEVVEVAAECGVVLVVFDTRARCTQGLEENSATDQGRAIDAAERIQRASGATVLVVHHCGRAGEHGRGSNAWDGAVFSDMRLTGGDQRCQIHCAKHKDVPDGCDHHYRLVPHVVPEGLMPACDLQQRSTLVAVQAGRLDEPAADRQSTRVVLDIIRNIGGDEGLTKKQIIDFAVERHVARSTAYEAVNALVKRAVVYNTGTDKRRVYVAESGDA